MFNAARSLPDDRPQSLPFDYWGKCSQTVARRTDLTHGAKMVLLAISILSRGRPGPVRATQQELADAAGVNVRTVRRAVEVLLREGLITWDKSAQTFTTLVRLRGEESATFAPSRPDKLSRPDRTNCPIVAAGHYRIPARGIEFRAGEREKERRRYC